jgi:hypothetical protein
MFDSVVLDVVIGLVFIYLLYSLLITILGELAISWLGVRARILRKAVEKMLNDGYPEKAKTGIEKVWYELGDFFLREPEEFKDSFAGKFYDQPSIKYLTRSQKRSPFLFRQSKPSYFSGRNFAETIIQIFRNEGAGKDDMERIRFSLVHNRLKLQPETLAHFKNLEHESANDLETFKTKLTQWFDETMDRASGWYKNKLRIILFLLGFFLAVAFNLDTIKMVSLLSKDKEARNQLVQMSISYVKDSTNKQYVNLGGDTVYNQTLYDSAYANVSRDIEDANHILGLGWDLDKLTKPFYCRIDQERNKELFEKVIRSNSELTALKDKTRLFGKQYRSYKDSAQAIESKVEKMVKDTLDVYVHFVSRGIDSSGRRQKKADSLNLASSRAAIANNMLLMKVTRMQFVADSVSFSKASKKEKAASQDLFKTLDKGFATIDSVKYESAYGTKCVAFYGTRHYTPREATCYIFHNGFCPDKKSFWGFLLTALALSLGAPFWFDLLKKLVSIRGGGVKPEEKASDPNVAVLPIDGLAKKKTPDPGPENDETPVEAVMRVYADEILKEKGVIKVAPGFMKDNHNIVKDCVQINVEDKDAAVRIIGKYSELKVGPDEIILSNVVVTGKPILKGNGTGNQALAIGNKTLKQGWGSYGCIVKSSFQPGMHVLSCFHVMKGDSNWNEVSGSQEIIKYDGSSVSTKYSGYLTNKLDVAYAEVSDGIAAAYMTNFPNPTGLLTITQKDVFNTNVVINGYMSSGLSGVIVHDSWAVDLEYTLDSGAVLMRRLEDLVVISTADADGQHSISQVGDSGSVVKDVNGNAIGIVVAGDARYTYVIKMTTILSSLELKLA